MPLKDLTSSNSSIFSLSRTVFAKCYDEREIDNKKWYGNSTDNRTHVTNTHSKHRIDYTQSVFNIDGNPTSFTTNNNINVQRQAVSRNRGTGGVPAKITMFRPIL